MTKCAFAVLVLATMFSQPACSSSSSDSGSGGAASGAGAGGQNGVAGQTSASGGSTGNAGAGHLELGGTSGGVGAGGVGGALGGAGNAGTAGNGGSAGAAGGSGGASGSGHGGGGSAGAPANDAWVGTWAASPQSGGDQYKDKTLRQIVHTSIAGTAARVQLSNAFGSKPVQVSDVHLAKRSSGSSVDMTTDHAVTFNGQTSVSIAVGAVAISDSVAFPVAALSDVAVSFYWPDSTGSGTYHQQGTQTNYFAAGDVSANKDLPSPSTMGSYYLLANLDVKNEAALGAVATLGASITDGVASSGDSNRRWPNDLAVRLNTANVVVGVLNQGISGNALLHDGAGQSAINRFTRDVLNQPDIKWVIFSDDPINDLGAGSGRPTGAQLISGLKQLVASAHQAHLKYLCSTLTPFEGSGGWSADGEVARGQVNAFIRSSTSGCDGVVDQDAATHDPANPTKYLPKYDAGDHLHPNEAGLQAIAESVDLTLFE